MPISDSDQQVINKIRNGEYPGLPGHFCIYRWYDDEAAAAMIDALSLTNDIKSLYIDSLNFGGTGVIALADLLRINRTLKSLKFGFHPGFLTKNGKTALSVALKDNVTLSILEIQDTMIDDEAAVALAEAIKSNITLKKICFEHCEITSKGADALAAAIKVNTSLESLSIIGCDMGDKGIATLVGALKANSTLLNISLSSNSLSDNLGSVLAEMLNVNTSLVSLRLDGCGMSAAQAKRLANALSSNHTIRELTFGDASMKNEDAEPLFEMLEKNTSIINVRAKHIFLDAAFKSRLSKVLKNNNTLEVLLLDDYVNFASESNSNSALLEALNSNTSLLVLSAFIDNDDAIREKINRNQTLISRELMELFLFYPFRLDENNTYESRLKVVCDEIKKIRAEHPEFNLPYRLLQFERLHSALTGKEQSNPAAYLRFLWEKLASYTFTSPTLQAIADDALASKLLADSSPSQERFVYGLWLSRTMLDYVCEHPNPGFIDVLKVSVMNHFSSTIDALNLDASTIMTYDYVRKLGYELLIDLKKSTEEHSSQFHYLKSLLRHNEYDPDTAKRLVQFLQVTGKLSVPVMLLEDVLVSNALVVHDFKKPADLETWASQEWEVVKDQPKPAAVLPAIIKDAKEKLNKALTPNLSQSKATLHASAATPDNSTSEPNKPPTLSQ